MEKKIYGLYGFDNKVAQCLLDVKPRFLQLVAKDERITGQLLTISKFKDSSIQEAVLYFLAAPDKEWTKVRLVLKHFDMVWSRLHKWTPTSGQFRDVEVASVGSFLREAGCARKHGSDKVSLWKAGGIAVVNRNSVVYSKLELQRGVKGWVAPKHVVRLLYPYLKK